MQPPPLGHILTTDPSATDLNHVWRAVARAVACALRGAAACGGGVRWRAVWRGAVACNTLILCHLTWQWLVEARGVPVYGNG